MSRSLSPKVLRELREYVSEQPGDHPCIRNQASLLAALDRALTPKRSAAPAKKRRTSKKAERRAEWEAIREKVLKRAGRECENCGRCEDRLAADHMFSGHGRRKTLQSVFTVIALCFTCDQARTRNAPSQDYWLAKFQAHLERMARLTGFHGDSAAESGFRHAWDMVNARRDAPATIQGRG